MKTKRKTKQSYQPSKFIPLLDRIARYYKQDPGMLKHVVFKAYPELLEKECCANCGASMAEYTHSIDTIDTLLIYGMARMVRDKLTQGIPFNLANQIHVQSKMNAYYSMASRTTWCSKLGLITKVLQKSRNGRMTHDQKAGWLITNRGWAFLRGEPVPKSVTTFRNKIVERPIEMTTIDEVLATKNKKLEKYQAELSTYDQSQWFDVARYARPRFI